MTHTREYYLVQAKPKNVQFGFGLFRYILGLIWTESPTKEVGHCSQYEGLRKTPTTTTKQPKSTWTRPTIWRLVTNLVNLTCLMLLTHITWLLILFLNQYPNLDIIMNNLGGPHKLAPLMFLTSCASSLGPCFVTPPTSSLSWEWLFTWVVRSDSSHLSRVRILLGRPPLSACAGSLSTCVDFLLFVVGCLPVSMGSHLGPAPLARLPIKTKRSSSSSSHPLAQSQILHCFRHYSLLGFITENTHKVFVIKLKTKG